VDKNGLLNSTTRRSEQWMPREVKKVSCDRVEPLPRPKREERTTPPERSERRVPQRRRKREKAPV
jgi:hypothetical protein